jgi:hypothetical protein
MGRGFVILTKRATRASACHPDKVSNASGRKDLGQLRASEAGTGFEIAQRSLFDGVTRASISSDWMQQRKTGTGGALAPLSEIRSSRR